MGMRKLIPLICGVAALGSQSALADTFNEKCPDIQTCAKVVSELLNQKYVFDTGDVKGKVTGTSNLMLSRDNAELLFTNMLYLEGFSRVPLGVPSTYQIMRQRDAKDAPIPTVEATKDREPELPAVWDMYTLRYKATNPDAVTEIARMTRNFMPPNTRIMASELDGSLLVTDAAPNLKKLYDLIRGMDHKPTSEMKKKWAEDEKARVEFMRHRMLEEQRQPRPEPGNAPAKKSS
jgi:type II secretory pathway component GspD/PulD (secretin)